MPGCALFYLLTIMNGFVQRGHRVNCILGLLDDGVSNYADSVRCFERNLLVMCNEIFGRILSSTCHIMQPC